MRRRIGELAVEAAMVVFAVLVALGFEQWRDEQRLIDLAARARAAVVAELRANLEEMQGAERNLLGAQERLESVLAERDLELLGGDLELTLPEISDAAWQAAQGSEAAPVFDYDWVISTARTYEVLEVYTSTSERIIEAMAGLIGREPTLEATAELFSWLLILNGVHGQAVDRLQTALAERS